MNDKCSESSLAAAYQVASRYFVIEEQLIWQRTSFFLALQSLAAAAIYYFRHDLHVWLSIVLPFSGMLYSICWYYSMNRAWAYQKFIIRIMREQEKALNLGQLGVFSRGRNIVEGGKGELVAGELTQFPASIVIIRAKVLADVTIWIFGIVYLVLFILGLSRVTISG